jgi:hypothetical protein
MNPPDEKPVINDVALEGAMRRELTAMDDALASEAARIGGSDSTRSKRKRSGLGIAQATTKYAMGDLASAVKIMREATAHADESMPATEPYRFYMHAVLADWLSEAGEHDEATAHIGIAWAFVTTEPAGAVYLEEVRERKQKVDKRRQEQLGSSEFA